jgi:Retrotransposon gag protein
MFDGSDTSLGNVTNWAFSVKEYIDLSDFPADKHTRIAAAFLDKDAKTWYRNNYASVDPPALDDFLRAFRDQFLVTHSDDDIINRLRKINQGEDPIGKYSTDFEMLVLQLGPINPHITSLTKPDYLRGLDHKIRRPLIPTLTGTETLKQLINKATIIARNLEYGKTFETKSPETKIRSSAEPRARFVPSSSPSSTSSTLPLSRNFFINREMDSSGKFSIKLTEPEKDHIKKGNGCLNYRRVRANHITSDCWEDYFRSGVFVKGKFLKKEHIEKTSVSALEVVESDYDSEYSRPKSVPTIKIVTQVKDVALLSTLVDCGAMINIISQDKVMENAITTHPMPPMKIREPVNPLGTRVDGKVTGKVKIPENNWES